jgi:uncharacterized coiled-coil protein SlyX
MRKRKIAGALGALILVTGLGAASPTPQSSTMPPVSSGHIEIDQLKALSMRMDKLEQDNAMKAAQIATLNAQLTAMKASMNTMQSTISTLQSHANDSVPIAGPGNCTSHGYTNAASLPANPGLMVYTWGTCKAP